MQLPNVIEVRRGSAHGAPVVPLTVAASNPHRVGGPHVAQPAVSEQMRKLELDVGVRLLRSGRLDAEPSRHVVAPAA